MNYRKVCNITDFARTRDKFVDNVDSALCPTSVHLALMAYANESGTHQDLIPHWCTEIKAFTAPLIAYKLKQNSKHARQTAVDAGISQGDILDPQSFEIRAWLKFKEEGLPLDNLVRLLPKVKGALEDLKPSIVNMNQQSYDNWLQKIKTI